MVACCTASLNTPVTVVPVATPVAPGAGVRLVTVGFVVSGTSVVKDQVTGSITLPTMSVAPLTVAVYVVPGSKEAVGVRVAVRLAAL